MRTVVLFVATMVLIGGCERCPTPARSSPPAPVVAVQVVADTAGRAVGGRVRGRGQNAASRTRGLREGLSRTEVIRLLGFPSWAVLPGDRGNFDTLDRSMHEALILVWPVPGCNPMTVVFNDSMQVMVWDGGGQVCTMGDAVNPTRQHSCARRDRRRYCQ